MILENLDLFYESQVNLEKTWRLNATIPNFKTRKI